MYDKLSIKEASSEINEIIKLAFDSTRHINISIDVQNKTAQWTSKNTQSFHITLSYENLISHIQWIFNNNLVQWLNEVWSITTGVPQGNQCSSALARLYLISQERKFIIYHTENPAGSLEIAKHFSNTYREMDDIISFNNDFFFSHILSDSPPQSTYNSKFFSLDFQSSHPSTSCNYLQLNIHIIENTQPIPVPQHIITINFNNLQKITTFLSMEEKLFLKLENDLLQNSLPKDPNNSFLILKHTIKITLFQPTP